MLDKLKRELGAWSSLELFWLALCSAVVLAVSLIWKDSPIGIIGALTGIWYVLFTGKGKRISFIIGMINVLCYSYISLGAKYYGEVMLNVLYYIPMNIIGWFAWSRHIDDKTGEVKKARLSAGAGIIIFALTCVGIVAYSYVLKALGGNMPFVDSASTVISITAMILSVKRLTEQWILWTVVNAITVVMWAVNLSHGGENIAMLAMWSIYLINGIVIFIKWNRETK